MVTEIKEARRRLRRAIGRSKEERWKEFCAILKESPWRRPYRSIRIKMARNTPPDGFRKDRVAKILEDLFITRRVEQKDEVHRFQISQSHGEEGQDLRITDWVITSRRGKL